MIDDGWVSKFALAQKYDSFFYSASFLERRIREEKARARDLSTSFCFLEIPYQGLTVPGAQQDAVEHVWRILMRELPKCLRGSDVRAYLPGGKGIGLLFLDTGDQAVHVFLHRIREPMVRMGLDAVLRSSQELLKHSYVYPLPEGTSQVAPMDESLEISDPELFVEAPPKKEVDPLEGSL